MLMICLSLTTFVKIKSIFRFTANQWWTSAEQQNLIFLPIMKINILLWFKKYSRFWWYWVIWGHKGLEIRKSSRTCFFSNLAIKLLETTQSWFPSKYHIITWFQHSTNLLEWFIMQKKNPSLIPPSQLLPNFVHGTKNRSIFAPDLGVLSYNQENSLSFQTPLFFINWQRQWHG